MGLFSSKKKTVVGTVAQRVIADDMLPNAVRTGVTKQIFSSGNEGGISEFVLEEMIASIGIKAERMYTYGRDHYVHGLPSGQMHSASAGRPVVQAVLNALEGTPVLIEYSQMGPPNNLHMGWMKLVELYGYNATTNELPGLSATIGETVYLDDLSVVVPAADALSYRAGALDQWGTPATAGFTPARPTVTAMFGALRPQSPVYADEESSTEFVEVDYTWQTSSTSTHLDEVLTEYVNHYDSLQISLDGVGDDTQDYFHVKYVVGGLTKFMMYRVGAGTYPTLDALVNTPPPENGTFFPFTYFRYDKVTETADKSTDSYKTGKKLVKYLGMGFDSIADSIDENPNIGDVEQAMLIMAVPANTADPLEQRYLYTFFENLYFNRGATSYSGPLVARITSTQTRDPNLTRNALVIQDRRFKMTVNDNGIFKKMVAGSIGAPGSYASGRGTETYEDKLVDYETGNETFVPRQREYHYYRKQITVGLYEEITVADLEVKYFVEGDNFTTADDEDNILLIPIDRSVTEHWSIGDRETLYSRSLHYVFNSLQIITVKWYQSDFFEFLMLVVTVFIAMFSGQGQLIAAALAGSTAAAITLIINLVLSYLIGLGIRLFVKAVGGELALVLAVVAMAWAGEQMLNTGSIAGAPWAQELLQLANGLTNAVSANAREAMQELMGQAEQFNSLRDESMKQLEAANKLLESNSHLSPFVIFGEKPDEFYNRTIHSGNIGVLSIGAISSYVETALRLPRLDDTLGESAYV